LTAILAKKTIRFRLELRQLPTLNIPYVLLLLSRDSSKVHISGASFFKLSDFQPKQPKTRTFNMLSPTAFLTKLLQRSRQS